MTTSSGPVVTGISIYPVKSCRRVDVDRAVVNEYGLVGDREWQVQGPAGQLMTQRKFPALARVQPTPIPGGIRLQCDGLPDLDVERPDAVNSEGNTMTGRVPVADAGDEAAAWFERVLSIGCRLTTIAAGYERRPLIGGDDPVRPTGVVRRRRTGPPDQRRVASLPARRGRRAVPDRTVPGQPDRRRI